MVLNDLHLTWATTSNLVLILWLTLIPWEFVYLKTGEGMGGGASIQLGSDTHISRRWERPLKITQVDGYGKDYLAKDAFQNVTSRNADIWWLVKLHIYDPWWIAHYIHGWWTSGLLYFTVYLPWKICFIFDMSLIKCRNTKTLNWAFN